MGKIYIIKVLEYPKNGINFGIYPVTRSHEYYSTNLKRALKKYNYFIKSAQEEDHRFITSDISLFVADENSGTLEVNKYININEGVPQF